MRVPHSAPRWRLLLGHQTSTLHVLEREGAVVASARVTEPQRAGEGRLVAEAAAVDAESAAALLAGAVHLAGGEEVEVVDRRPPRRPAGARAPPRRRRAGAVGGGALHVRAPPPLAGRRRGTWSPLEVGGPLQSCSL